jgi:hypothetical protein
LAKLSQLIQDRGVVVAAGAFLSAYRLETGMGLEGQIDQARLGA